MIFLDLDGTLMDDDAAVQAAAGMHGVWLNRNPGLPADPRVPTIRSLGELPALALSKQQR